jgi:F-type H+-transporting ATPase subunit a
MAGDTFIFLDKAPIHDIIDKPATVEMAGGLVNNGLEAAPILHAGLTAIILLTISFLISNRYKKDAKLPTDKTFSLANLMELAVGGLLNFMRQTMGEHAGKFIPLIGTTAIFILISNLMGTIPGFDPPTSNINTTLACAIVIFIATHYVGIRTHGASYIKHFLGPVWWLAPAMLIIELIGHFARVASLSVRLFGNMFGDHMVLAIFMGLVPLLIPVIFMGLGVFVSCVQALVFTLLSILYISGALEEAH